MSTTKYIVGVMYAGYVERPVAIVFPEYVDHDAMADAVFSNRRNILGAGFCYINDDDKAVAYGSSTSLKIEARPAEDSVYISEALGLGPVVEYAVRSADLKTVRNRLLETFVTQEMKEDLRPDRGHGVVAQQLPVPAVTNRE